MLSHNHVRRVMTATVVAIALLTTTVLTGAAQPNRDGPSEYRDCWLGNQEHYDDCVMANNWGANFVFATEAADFVFPDRDDVSLTIGGIPSY